MGFDCCAQTTMLVRIPAPPHTGLLTGVAQGLPKTRVVTISRLCPECGCLRGDPVSQICWDGATEHYFMADCWDNPCGHRDRYDDIFLEVALQCARFGCVTPAETQHFPHCSARCAGADWITAARRARKSAAESRLAHQRLWAALRAVLADRAALSAPAARGELGTSSLAAVAASHPLSPHRVTKEEKSMALSRRAAARVEVLAAHQWPPGTSRDRCSCGAAVTSETPECADRAMATHQVMMALNANPEFSVR